jgi:hypothetical protein
MRGAKLKQYKKGYRTQMRLWKNRLLLRLMENVQMQGSRNPEE